MIDIVTVYHNYRNETLARERLLPGLREHEPNVNVILVSNRENNRGFSKACNLGAWNGKSPIIGFLNPDLIVEGPFVERVKNSLSKNSVVITGERFGKSDRELKHWGVKDWVCGACLFVERDWFEAHGGFDEGYVMYWEETDLIRQAESEGLIVRSISLPVQHESPTAESDSDRKYKRYHFKASADRFRKKWRIR